MQSHFVRGYLLAALVAATVLLPRGSMAQQVPKFAYINSQVILQRAPGAAEIQAQLAKEREQAQGTVQRLSDSLRTLFDEYQKAQASLTQQQRDQREKALREKQQEFDQRINELDEKMQRRQMELVQPLMDQIREVLDKIRNEEGYTFIFDVGADVGVIVAADRNLDITERVIARLKPVPVNVTPKADSAKAPAATKPPPAGIRKPPLEPQQR
jgi:outer membrane protein